MDATKTQVEEDEQGPWCLYDEKIDQDKWYGAVNFIT